MNALRIDRPLGLFPRSASLRSSELGIPAPLFLLLLLALSFHPTATRAAEFTYENLNGKRIAISNEPFFILTTRSDSDLKDALRCASYLEGLNERPRWLIDLAWPQSETAKRMATKRLLKSELMKERSAILEQPTLENALVALIDDEGRTIWSSESYPSDRDWEQALTAFRDIDSQ